MWYRRAGVPARAVLSAYISHGMSVVLVPVASGEWRVAWSGGRGSLLVTLSPYSAPALYRRPQLYPISWGPGGNPRPRRMGPHGVGMGPHGVQPGLALA
jgi:hypothetical protein